MLTEPLGSAVKTASSASSRTSRMLIEGPSAPTAPPVDAKPSSTSLFDSDAPL
jgi:hypothetical protein